MAALALEDDPEHGSAAADVLNLALGGLPHAMSSYAPDGMWPAGPPSEAYMSRCAGAAAATVSLARCAPGSHSGAWPDQ